MDSYGVGRFLGVSREHHQMTSLLFSFGLQTEGLQRVDRKMDLELITRVSLIPARRSDSNDGSRCDLYRIDYSTKGRIGLSLAMMKDSKMFFGARFKSNQ